MRQRLLEAVARVATERPRTVLGVALALAVGAAATYFTDDRFADAEREIRAARPALPARWQAEADRYLRRIEAIRARQTP